MTCGSFGTGTRERDPDHLITTDNAIFKHLGLSQFTLLSLWEAFDQDIDIRRFRLVYTSSSGGSADDLEDPQFNDVDPFGSGYGVKEHKLTIFRMLTTGRGPGGYECPFLFRPFDMDTHRQSVATVSGHGPCNSRYSKNKKYNDLSNNSGSWGLTPFEANMAAIPFYAIMFNKAYNAGVLEPGYQGNVDSPWTHRAVWYAGALRQVWRQFIIEVRSSKDKCIEWNVDNEKRLLAAKEGLTDEAAAYGGGVNLWFNFQDPSSPAKGCWKLLAPHFKLFLYGPNNVSHKNQIVLADRVAVSTTPVSPFGKRTNFRETNQQPHENVARQAPARGDSTDNVAAEVDLSYNYNTGKMEGGTSNILARLLTNIGPARVNQIPVEAIHTLDQFDCFDIDSPTNMADFTSGKAMPLSIHNGNPHQFGPIWVDPDCEGDKKEVIDVTNRSAKGYAAGDIVMCFKIDGLWVIMDFGEARNIGVFGIDNWKFMQYIANRDFYFKNAAYYSAASVKPILDTTTVASNPQAGGGGSVSTGVTNYASARQGFKLDASKAATVNPTSYQQHFKNHFYYKVGSFADNIVDEAGELLVNYEVVGGASLGLPKNPFTMLGSTYNWIQATLDAHAFEAANDGYYQTSSFDLVDKIMGGTNVCHAITRTHLSQKPDGTIEEGDIDEQSKDVCWPFWGVTFPNGYRAEDIEETKRLAAKQELSIGKTPLRTRASEQEDHFLLGPAMPSSSAANIVQTNGAGNPSLSQTGQPALPADQRLVFSNSVTPNDVDDLGAGIIPVPRPGLWSNTSDKQGLQIPADIATLASPSGQNGGPMEDLGGMMRLASVGPSFDLDGFFHYMGYNEHQTPNRMTWLTKGETVIPTGGGDPSVKTNPAGDDSLYDWQPVNNSVIEFKPLWMDLVGSFDPFSSMAGAVGVGLWNNRSYTGIDSNDYNSNWWDSAGVGGLGFWVSPISVAFLGGVVGNYSIFNSSIVLKRWNEDGITTKCERYMFGDVDEGGDIDQNGTAPLPVAGDTPFQGIPYGPWLRTHHISPAIPNWNTSLEEKSSNVVGVICASAKLTAKATELSFHTQNHLGLSAKLTTSGGGSSFGIILGGGGTFVVAGNPAEKINTNKFPTWGRTNDSPWMFGTTAIHARLFDQWPDEQTLFDTRYFAVMHFNPLSKKGNVSSTSSYVTTNTYNRDKITTVTVNEDLGTAADVFSNWVPGTPYPAYKIDVEQVDTLVDFGVPTWRNGEIIAKGTIIKGWMHKGRGLPNVKHPGINELMENAGKWRISIVRRGMLLPCVYPFRTIGLAGGTWPFQYDPTTDKKMRGSGYAVGDILMAAGGHGTGCELKVTEVGAQDEDIDGDGNLHDAGAIKGFVFNVDALDQPMIGEGYLPQDFWDEDPDTNATRDEAGAPIYFKTVTGEGYGASMNPHYGVVWDKLKVDGAPKERGGLKKITPNSNPPDGTDGVGRVLGQYKTTIGLEEPSEDGKYNIFLMHHNDPQHYVRTHLSLDNWNQYCTLEISTQ